MKTGKGKMRKISIDSSRSDWQPASDGQAIPKPRKKSEREHIYARLEGTAAILLGRYIIFFQSIKRDQIPQLMPYIF